MIKITNKNNGANKPHKSKPEKIWEYQLGDMWTEETEEGFERVVSTEEIEAELDIEEDSQENN